MRKIIYVIMLVSFMAVSAFADWQVTVSGWTMSPGPDLAYEQVLQDGIVVNIANGFPSDCDNILPGDSKSCVWTIPTKTDQQIIIRSVDTNAGFADNTVGNVGTGPNPSSGGSIIVIWQ